MEALNEMANVDINSVYMTHMTSVEGRVLDSWILRGLRNEKLCLIKLY